ncbi:MAG TPA: efflux RND transporter permease subunit, partial [Candidatus Polarisedimenticolaceae bacterium]|nr:efflux RND transporter permease subunit [Candidatus Polarisedimenticolaceae bacterium]
MTGIGISGRIAGAFIGNKLTPLLAIAALVLGLMATLATPREEEPQIVVPMIDVMIGWPGASAEDVERLVTVPLERALREIPEVRYVYATSRPSAAMLIAQFYVNSDPERALINVRDKAANAGGRLPAGVAPATITSRSIDDVPILALTLASGRYDPLTLRRIAAEIEEDVRQIPGVSTTTLIGGLGREIRVELDLERLAARGLAPAVVLDALERSGVALPAGSVGSARGELLIETGELLRSAAEVGATVLASPDGSPVHLRDVAAIHDGAAEPRLYVMHAEHGRPSQPAVTLSVAKIEGANATDVAQAVLQRVERMRGRIVPEDVTLTVTRDYGETAKQKSDELILHLIVATASVVLLMAVSLGVRAGLIVGVAVPVTLSLTLLIYYLWGYTLNRVTLFALIFSIGILVDDAIVVVENILRHLRMKKLPPLQAAVFAVDEVGNPTILATFTVIAAILPMAFVSGLMGPYMRPIPVGASFAMLISLLVAFTVSPWIALRVLRRDDVQAGRASDAAAAEGWHARAYRRLMRPLIERPLYRWVIFAGVVVLLLGVVALVPLKVVTVKMLPFDNKSELQLIVDAREGTTLEDTLAAARAMADRLAVEPEVRDIQIYAGTSAPFNFNGLVRHYFLRSGANVADLQINLMPKEQRRLSSHEMARKVRPLVVEIARRHGVRVKVAEIPPGPPVLSTLVAEVYASDRPTQIAIAERVLAIFESTDGVVDSDWYVEADQPKLRFVVDREKAALAGVDPEQIAITLRLAVDGIDATMAHPGDEREPVPIRVTLPRAARARDEVLRDIRLIAADGSVVPLSEVARVESTTARPYLYRKNGRAVTYVIGDVAGSEESPVYAILAMSDRIRQIELSALGAIDERMVDDPLAGDREAVVWDGEWQITYEVFRDLGVAFAAVLVLIYVLVVAWFQSFTVPFVIMAPIPLTLVGILPAHAATGAFFTATSMIGMIALAGIIVRNSILLVDFITLGLERGQPLRDAVVA